jgi:hypothetical protein
MLSVVRPCRLGSISDPIVACVEKVPRSDVNRPVYIIYRLVPAASSLPLFFSQQDSSSFSSGLGESVDYHVRIATNRGSRGISIEVLELTE